MLSRDFGFGLEEEDDDDVVDVVDVAKIVDVVAFDVDGIVSLSTQTGPAIEAQIYPL
jgi:hypothetical protein